MIMSNKNFPVPLTLNENCPNSNPLVNPICYYNADSKDIKCICDTSNIGNSYPLLTFGSSNQFSLVLLTSNILNTDNIPKCSLTDTKNDISCSIVVDNVTESKNKYLNNSSPSGLKVLSSNICITTAKSSANTWKLVKDTKCSNTAFLNSFSISYNQPYKSNPTSPKGASASPSNPNNVKGASLSPSNPIYVQPQIKNGGIGNGSTTPQQDMPK